MVIKQNRSVDELANVSAWDPRCREFISILEIVWFL